MSAFHRLHPNPSSLFHSPARAALGVYYSYTPLLVPMLRLCIRLLEPHRWGGLSTAEIRVLERKSELKAAADVASGEGFGCAAVTSSLCTPTGCGEAAIGFFTKLIPVQGSHFLPPHLGGWNFNIGILGGHRPSACGKAPPPPASDTPP